MPQRILRLVVECSSWGQAPLHWDITPRQPCNTAQSSVCSSPKKFSLKLGFAFQLDEAFLFSLNIKYRTSTTTGMMIHLRMAEVLILAALFLPADLPDHQPGAGGGPGQADPRQRPGQDITCLQMKCCCWLLSTSCSHGCET